MIKKEGFAFEFELPDDWSDDSGDGPQVVAHGPHDEELIVSGAVISGAESRAGIAPVRQAVLNNAFQAIAGGADHPELKITKTLNREDAGVGLECWTIHAETTDAATLFLQAVVGGDRSVMIATIEGPNQEFTFEAFQSFLKGVRQVVAH